MEKVQKLNELMEANKVLTSEKDNAEETVRELVMKVSDEHLVVQVRCVKCLYFLKFAVGCRSS